jgi:predicted DNA-binding antitoxin AbrB/MazE fold protein
MSRAVAGYNGGTPARPPAAEDRVMAITVEAVYEDGVLKLAQSLPACLDGQRVWITLHVDSEPDRVQSAYGLIGWTGDAETVRRVALDPEFDAPEEP